MHPVRGVSRNPYPYDACVSDPGPLDPFEGLPIFGDLARIFQQSGSAAWEAARQLASQVAAGGESEPNVDPADRIAIEQLARVAELQVAKETGLTASSEVSILATTRTSWATSTLAAYRPLFERLAGSLGDSPALDDDDPTSALFGTLMQMLAPMMLGMTAGSMVGHLARRSLGSYDLPLPRPAGEALLVVPANIDELADEWSLPPDDLRLWVCVHDVASHLVLHVPSLHSRLLDLLERYVSSFRSDPASLESSFGELDLADPSSLERLQSSLQDPDTVLGAIRSAEQEALLPELEALVAVIVGYIDHAVDCVAGELIPSARMLSEALRRRRVTADPSDRFVERLLGLELGQDQYDRGQRFVAGVLERGGADGLARLFESEANIPTPPEVDAPGLWLARIDLPPA